MQCQNNEAASCRRMGVAHHVCTSWLALDCFIQLLRRGTEQQAHVLFTPTFLDAEFRHPLASVSFIFAAKVDD